MEYYELYDTPWIELCNECQITFDQCHLLVFLFEIRNKSSKLAFVSERYVFHNLLFELDELRSNAGLSMMSLEEEINPSNVLESSRSSVFEYLTQQTLVEIMSQISTDAIAKYHSLCQQQIII